VGISPAGAWDGTATPIYAPVGDNGKHEAVVISDIYEIDEQTPPATPAEWWSIILPADKDRDFSDAGVPIDGGPDFVLRKSGYVSYLNTLSAELAVFKGDICAYLSGRPGIPEGYWRLPTSAEFDYPSPFTSPGNYAREGTVDENATPDNVTDDVFVWKDESSVDITDSETPDGTYRISNGYRLTYNGGKTVFFPTSGNRHFLSGALNFLGQRGYAWSSSPDGASGHYLSFNAVGVYPENTLNRTYGFPVRCVKK
jgi:hypothetical protein